MNLNSSFQKARNAAWMGALANFALLIALLFVGDRLSLVLVIAFEGVFAFNLAFNVLADLAGAGERRDRDAPAALPAAEPIADA